MFTIYWGFKRKRRRLYKIIHRRFLTHIPQNLTAGLVAAIVALPISLAFGEVSGLGALAGLYGAMACGIVAALFGGTKNQITGPTGPMTVVAAAMIAENPDKPELLFFALILGGFLQLVLAWLKTGQYVYYLPYSVISGFMTGIGLIIICLQLLPMIGFKGKGDILESLEQFTTIISQFQLENSNIQALIIGLITLAIIYLFPLITKKIPSTLVALVAGSGLVFWLNWEIPMIPAIPDGFIEFNFPALHALSELHIIFTGAITLALLGTIDSLLTSVVVDKMTDTRHNSDQELMGQGLGNILSGFIGGLPGAGATMRSVASVNAGGTNYLPGVVHGLLILIIVFWLKPFVSLVPLACLAGILVSVGISIVDRRGLKHILHAPKADVLVMAVVLFLTVFDNLIMAVGVGVALASILFVKHLSDSQFSEHGELDEWYSKWYKGKGQEDKIQDAIKHKVYVYQFNGPLFFGEAKNFNKTLPTLLQYSAIILHFANVPIIDQTGAYALEDAIRQIEDANKQVYITDLTEDVRQTLWRFDILKHLHLEGQSFLTFDQAVQEIQSQQPQPKPELSESSILPS